MLQPNLLTFDQYRGADFSFKIISCSSCFCLIFLVLLLTLFFDISVWFLVGDGLKPQHKRRNNLNFFVRLLISLMTYCRIYILLQVICVITLQFDEQIRRK